MWRLSLRTGALTTPSPLCDISTNERSVQCRVQRGERQQRRRERLDSLPPWSRNPPVVHHSFANETCRRASARPRRLRLFAGAAALARRAGALRRARGHAAAARASARLHARPRAAVGGQRARVARGDCGGGGVGASVGARRQRHFPRAWPACRVPDSRPRPLPEVGPLVRRGGQARGRRRPPCATLLTRPVLPSRRSRIRSSARPAPLGCLRGAAATARRAFG